jgi:hypothetical protein
LLPYGAVTQPSLFPRALDYLRLELNRIYFTLGGLVIVLALVLGALLASSPEHDARAQGPSETPVVEIVFDELPTATLMNPSSTRINAKRFPGFAKLAAHSTWYRNNTTVADFTGRALPAIETGVNPGYNTLPIASQQPDSIFTLLGGKYRFNVSEPVTRVCPPSLCGKGKGRAGGPVKGRSAGEFAQSLFEKPRPKLFRRFLKRIRDGRSFNFIHFEVPHEPFHFLPDGRSYNFTPISDVGNHNAQKWAGGAGGTATTWQRHFIQTGYADTLTTRLIKRLKKVGIWNRALVIVTADHGISFDPDGFRRIAFPGNFGGVANPPLFIKYPGQRKGEVSDAHTRTVDIVPTTAQVLGIELPYRTDGEPISADRTQDGSGTESVTIFNALKKDVSEPFSELLDQRDVVLRRSARLLGARTGLFQLGPRPSLLGRRAPRVSRRSARIDSRLDFRDLSIGGDAKVPAFINGTVAGGLAGSVIAIGVNGRIVATCRAFRFRGRTRWGAVVPPSSLRQGSNSIGVYRARSMRLIALGGN